MKAIKLPAATAPNPAFGPNGETYTITADQMDAAPYAGRILKMN